jgi:ABC-type sugar transport system permease subunit
LWKRGLACGIVAFYLIIISFFGPWFNIHTEYTYCDHPINRDYGLRGSSNDYFGHLSGYYYSSVVDRAEYKGMYQLFFVIEMLVVSALVCTFFFLLLALFMRQNSYRGKFFRIFGVVASILAISSVVMFALIFPPVFERQVEEWRWLNFVSGFCGASGDPIMDPTVHSWGPGWAWYTMVAAAALILIGVRILRNIAREEEEHQGEYDEQG